MSKALVIKASRLLLAVSVSVWMAGGCLFGCSGSEVLADEVSRDANELTAAVSGDSCNKARQHDCCTRPIVRKTSKQIARQTRHITRAPLRASEPVLTALPQAMKDCPLMTNGTAVTVKSSGNLPDPGYASVELLPAIKHTSEQTQFTLVQSYLPNRGPTHLRCCVFLI